MRFRNIPVLSIGQALATCGPATVVLLGGIIGSQMAPSPSLATLPVTMNVIGMALATIPAAYLMKRIGRRSGFMIAAGVASAGALLAGYAIGAESFLLFCTGILLMGVNTAFVLQYRFAAAESVEPEYVSRAVSYVLLGGIAAGFLGPEIAKRSINLSSMGLYTGSFFVASAIYIIVVILLAFLKPTEPSTADDHDVGERPLVQVIRQPVFLVAVLAGAVAYGVMSFLMTAMPVNMHVIGDFSIDQTTVVIQSHIIAMYLPSLFTGAIIQRFGVLRVMLGGLFALLLCALLALVSQAFLEFWGALVLLGVGWNFLFVGATVLLTRSYRPAERFKTQAVNDFSIISVQAVASLSAGTLLYAVGWQVMSLVVLVPLILLLGTLVVMRGEFADPSNRPVAAQGD